MDRKYLLLLVIVLPVSVIAQCAPEDTDSVSKIVDWVYSIFGDKILKVFACLYGMGIVFKVLELLLTKIVAVTTWTEKDNEFLKKLYGHWSYKFLSFLAEIFLRLKLPGKKK